MTSINVGKGAAVRSGLKYATATSSFPDADLELDPEE